MNLIRITRYTCDRVSSLTINARHSTRSLLVVSYMGYPLITFTMLKTKSSIIIYILGIRLPAPPLDTSSLKKARVEREKELKMMESIKQVIITCVCLWIIYSISYSNRDTRSYNFHQNIATKLLTPQDKTLMTFAKVSFGLSY